MNLIDWKGDLRMAFYKSSKKTILYLGEEKQRDSMQWKTVGWSHYQSVSGAKT